MSMLNARFPLFLVNLDIVSDTQMLLPGTSTRQLQTTGQATDVSTILNTHGQYTLWALTEMSGILVLV